MFLKRREGRIKMCTDDMSGSDRKKYVSISHVCCCLCIYWGKGEPSLKIMSRVIIPPGHTMKQICGEKEKPFTSSLNGYPEAYSIAYRQYTVERGGGGRSNATPPAPPPPSPPSYFWSVEISFKDDITIILLLGVSFMGYACPLMVHNSLSIIRYNYTVT